MARIEPCVYHKTEYGILEDRRIDGLGIQLQTVCSSLERAQALVAKRPADAYPVEIKVREVCHTEWATPQWVPDVHKPETERRG